MKPSHNLDMGFETKKLADRSSLDVATMCGTKNDQENMTFKYSPNISLYDIQVVFTDFITSSISDHSKC